MILQPNEEWGSTVTEITEQLDWNEDTPGIINGDYWIKNPLLKQLKMIDN